MLVQGKDDIFLADHLGSREQEDAKMSSPLVTQLYVNEGCLEHPHNAGAFFCASLRKPDKKSFKHR